MRAGRRGLARSGSRSRPRAIAVIPGTSSPRTWSVQDCATPGPVRECLRALVIAGLALVAGLVLAVLISPPAHADEASVGAPGAAENGTTAAAPDTTAQPLPT